MRQFALVCALIVFIAASAHGVVPVAGDNAANYAPGTWVNNSNQGFGFQPWKFSNSSGGTSGPNWFQGSSATNGAGDTNSDGDIDSAGKAWGLSADSSTVVDAQRKFANPMSVGMTFSIDLDHGTLPSGKNASLGIGFFGVVGSDPENGYAQFAIFGSADTANYYFFDGNGDGVVAHDTGLPRTTEGIHIDWTLTSPTTYHAAIKSLLSSSVVSIDAALYHPELLTNYFYVRDNEIGTSTAAAFFANNLSITDVPEPASALLTVVAMGFALKRRRSI